MSLDKRAEKYVNITKIPASLGFNIYKPKNKKLDVSPTPVGHAKKNEESRSISKERFKMVSPTNKILYNLYKIKENNFLFKNKDKSKEQEHLNTQKPETNENSAAYQNLKKSTKSIFRNSFYNQGKKEKELTPQKKPIQSIKFVNMPTLNIVPMHLDEMKVKTNKTPNGYLELNHTDNMSRTNTDIKYEISKKEDKEVTNKINSRNKSHLMFNSSTKFKKMNHKSTGMSINSPIIFSPKNKNNEVNDHNANNNPNNNKFLSDNSNYFKFQHLDVAKIGSKQAGVVCSFGVNTHYGTVR